jgi:hypothetical protein
MVQAENSVNRFDFSNGQADSTGNGAGAALQIFLDCFFLLEKGR